MPDIFQIKTALGGSGVVGGERGLRPKCFKNIRAGLQLDGLCVMIYRISLIWVFKVTDQAGSYAFVFASNVTKRAQMVPAAGVYFTMIFNRY